MQHHRNFPVDETRCVLAAKHFLQPHSQDGQIGCLILHADSLAARDRQMGGGQAFELALLFPGEECVQGLAEIKPRDSVECGQSEEIAT